MGIKMRILGLVMCAALLFGPCSADVPVKDPPDAWTAVLALLTAYAYEQSGCEYPDAGPRSVTPTVDADGSTAWYQNNFQDKKPLKQGYTIKFSDPVPDPATAKLTPARTSTLLCPYKPFPYYCALSGGAVQTTGSSSITSKQLSAGVGLTYKSSFGANFLGNGVSVVDSISATYSITEKDDSVQATSDTETQTSGQFFTTDPTSGNCTFITTNLKSLTASATIEVQAVFRGYVGFKTDQPVYWGSDNQYTNLRVQDIATIVNNSRSIGGCKNYPSSLPQVDGFESYYNATTNDNYVVFSNTFRVDYYQGADANSNMYTYENTSAACLNNNPGNLSLPGLSFQGSGRHLLASGSQDSATGPRERSQMVWTVSGRETEYQLSSSGALYPVSEEEDEEEYISDRKLLQTARRKDTCPKVAFRIKGGVKEVPDPNCYGPKRRNATAIKVAARKQKAAFKKHCYMTLQPFVDRANSSTQLPGVPGPVPGTYYKVHLTGKQCKFNATKPLHKPLPADAQPETLDVKINRLINALCYFNTGLPCDGIDYDHSYAYVTSDQRLQNATYYWADGTLNPLTVTLGMTSPDFSEYSLKTETLNATCHAPPDHPNSAMCEAVIADLNTQGTTDTTTTTQSLSIGASIGVQVKTNILGADASAEVSLTSSLSYSWSTGQSTSFTNGQSTTATVRVPIPQNGCVKVNANLTTVRSGSAVQAYACMDGFVQVLQKGPCQYTFDSTDVETDCDEHQCPFWPYPVMKNKYLVRDGCVCTAWGSCWQKTSPEPDQGFTCRVGDTDCSDYDTTQGSVPPSIRFFSMAWAVQAASDANLQDGGVSEWYIDDQGRACLSQPISVSFEQGVVVQVNPQVYEDGSGECNSVPKTNAPVTAIETPAGFNGTGWVKQQAVLTDWVPV